MTKSTAEQVRGELMLLHQGWTQAVGSVKDYTFLDRHIADGWIYTDYTGVQRGKDEYLRLVAGIASYTQVVRRFDVRVAGGGVGIVSGVYQAHAELKGGVTLDNTIAFSAVWELQDGVWRALLHHTTRIPDAP
jgi:ketosteroid isomerase-like protein